MKLSLKTLALSRMAWLSKDYGSPGPYWLQLLWTGLFALPIGLLFTVLGFVFGAQGSEWTNGPLWLHWLGINLFISLFISFSIHGLFELAIRLIGRQQLHQWPDRRRRLFFSLLPLFGVALSWPVAAMFVDGHIKLFDGQPGSINAGVGAMLFVLMLSLLMNLYFTGKAQAAAARRRESEAQLKLLQAQIEPHFLFNSLANVVSLIDVDPSRARALLESFIDFLRASMGSLRTDTHSLADEMRLVRAYLEVLGHRMDDRLSFELEIDEALLALPLPVLMLQPLVENAVRHGLEPKIEGGCIRLRAWREADQLLIEVADDGLGLQAQTSTAGSGTAVANIRERLRHAFGDRAALTLKPHPSGGTVARLNLPVPTQRT